MSCPVKRKAEEMAPGTGASGNPPPPQAPPQKYPVKFTNYVVAKAAPTLTQRSLTRIGKIRLISSCLAPCDKDRGKDSVKLKCNICHKREDYGLRSPIDEKCLEQSFLPQTDGTLWTKSSLRKELRAIGVECPACLRPGDPPPVPFKRHSTSDYFLQKKYDGFPKKEAPMKTVGQMLRGMMPFLETVVTSELALRELRRQFNDDTLLDMDQLQDLESDDKYRLHKMSKTLKYHTDAYMRDQDNMSRDEARNKQIVMENDIVLMESSFDVTESYAATLKNPIEPYSGMCESSRACQKTNKYRPHQIEHRDKETFTTKRMYTFGKKAWDKVPEEQRKEYMMTEAVDVGVDNPSDQGKIAVCSADKQDGFICAKAETRRYDEPMMAFKGSLPLPSKITSSFYSDIVARKGHEARVQEWLADGLSLEELDAYKCKAEDMYSRGWQMAEDEAEAGVSCEEPGSLEAEEAAFRARDDSAPVDDEQATGGAPIAASPSSSSTPVSEEETSIADSAVEFACGKPNEHEHENPMSPTSFHSTASASVESLKHPISNSPQDLAQEKSQNIILADQGNDATGDDSNGRPPTSVLPPNALLSEILNKAAKALVQAGAACYLPQALDLASPIIRFQNTVIAQSKTVQRVAILVFLHNWPVKWPENCERITRLGDRLMEKLKREC
ncbi:hypothetical protein PRZ48_002426 [Zasmidium cellare]|uniref:Uncharacterized protein n=1 Tax=Zasmidium cellare TaxID=395010 RepID=A0ABR0F4Q6_ZASCE|nr:hypothetical protein PRZ48_002426 [Zasmidium cellare]